MFAQIREAYGIERDDSMKLRDYPTLNHVVGFVLERAGVPAGAAPTPAAPAPAAPAPEPAPEPAPAPVAAPVAVSLETADDPRFPRRVPLPVLRPQLKHCVNTGVTIQTGSRIVMMPDAGGVATRLTARLTELGAEVLTVDGAPDVEALEAQIGEWTAAGPIQGVYWLPALDDEGPLAKLDAGARRDALHVRVKLLAATMRALAGEETFLISGTRLGGRHGYDAEGATSILGGAVTGFTKALSRERPQRADESCRFRQERRSSSG